MAPVWRLVRPFVRGGVLAFFLALSVACAQAPSGPAQTDPGSALSASSFRVLSGLAADTPFDAVADRFAAGEGAQPDGAILNVGLTWDKLWAVRTLHNDGPGVVTWQLRTPLVAAGELQVLLLRDSAPPETLLAVTFRDGFARRPENSRTLISAPFRLAPGETARLAVGYRPLGFSRLPLWLETPAEIRADAAAQARGDAVFYATTGMLIACFLGFCLVIRNRPGAWFAGVLVLNLGVVAQIEGHLFRYLWPDAPLFNLNATLPVILVAAAFGYLTTLRTEPGTLGRRARLLLRGAVLLCLAHLGATPFAHPVLTLPGTLGLWIGNFVAIVFTLKRWRAFSRMQRRVGRAVAGAMLVMAVVSVPAWLSGDAPVWMTSDLVLRLTYLLGAGGLMVLLLMQVAGLYRAHQAALQDQIEAARTEADLNAALLQIERDYSEAMRRATAAGRKLAAAAHDLRQPLAALRLLLQQDAAVRTDPGVGDALAYLDRLATGFAAEPDRETSEAYDLAMVLGAAADMFRDEAQQHGIELHVSGRDVPSDVPTLIVMRIVSNLTVNAIRHSGGTSVTLAVARVNDRGVISVTNDGVAMTAQEFARYLDHGAKGPTSGGDGLGLAIIAELCAANGLGLSLDPTCAGGTRLIVTLPLAAGNCCPGDML